MSNDRKTSLLRDRPARRAVKRAYRIWVSDAAHHCVQLRNDLLFTMSDNLHRVIEDRRDTNSNAWTSMKSDRGPTRDWWSQTGSNRRPPACKAGALPTELWPLSAGARLRTRRLAEPKPRSGEGWWSQTESNRRPPACKAGALPTELWPLAASPLGKNGGPGKTRTSDLTLIKRALKPTELQAQRPPATIPHWNARGTGSSTKKEK